MSSLSPALAELPADIVRTAPDDLAPHLTDWRGQKTGSADALLLPRSTAEVVAIVEWAGRHGVGLVPQGGNTGLVGGGVPEPAPHGPAVILSLRRMNAIESIDPAGLVLVAGAGAILANVHEAAEQAGCRFPLSLGAKGSATIGGLVSTNAGGVQVLRHGTMRALVLGLEAVLPDGSVLDQLSALRKDNSGYDLKQLLIGAEGTLGVVTRVALRLSPALVARSTGWVGLDSPEQALAVLKRLRAEAGETVESFELIAAEALELTLHHMPALKSPLQGKHRYHVLIELGGPSDMLESVLMAAIEAGEAEDAAIAASDAQAEAMWLIRETIPEAEKRDGGSIKNDISVAVADIPAFHAEAVQMLEAAYPGTRPFVFGHLGDGNLHWNILPPPGAQPLWLKQEGEQARHLLHDLIAQHQGSISAEHGIGTLKAAELARLGNPAKLAAMRAIKSALDPQGIMNPAKLFA
ncbi:FAD-binding oxidoreductase [Sandaracinobacter neustonicus]|uniref:FAD-binding oxidoreductase n=1 Tax=Sandaracinobacter neustonicus TaxID=1715348 RepID=A0A501XSV4_9SPHN|nr:FAD-binding oxidoreductase [Sandaracinobacter neustonicus]TPE63748.1 FAD-binding oxidoreductase [Sandaracinobacter neustonicus]